MQEEKPQEEGDTDINVTPIVVAGGTADEEPVEEEEDSISEKQWEVTCPSCSKLVRTQAGSLYHRCPSCNNVFELQKQVKDLDENEDSQESTEAQEENE